MLKLVFFLQSCIAHRMMLTWNCGNSVYQGAFTENVPCETENIFLTDITVQIKIYFFIIQPCFFSPKFIGFIQMADLQKLLKVKASTTAPQLNFLSTLQDGKKVEELSDLDDQISQLLNKGEKVVLLGKHFNAQPEPQQEKTQRY